MNFSDILNIEYIENNDEYVKAKMMLKKEFANNINSLHGGITASIADSGSGHLASSLKIMTPTNNMSIYYLNPIRVKEGDYIYAEAKTIKRGKKIIVINCQIFDSNYNLSADATTSFSPMERKISKNK